MPSFAGFLLSLDSFLSLEITFVFFARFRCSPSSRFWTFRFGVESSLRLVRVRQASAELEAVPDRRLHRRRVSGRFPCPGLTGLDSRLGGHRLGRHHRPPPLVPLDAGPRRARQGGPAAATGTAGEMVRSRGGAATLRAAHVDHDPPVDSGEPSGYPCCGCCTAMKLASEAM
jgi:hypothetical protein